MCGKQIYLNTSKSWKANGSIKRVVATSSSWAVRRAKTSYLSLSIIFFLSVPKNTLKILMKKIIGKILKSEQENFFCD